MTTTYTTRGAVADRLETLIANAVGDASIVTQAWPASDPPAEGVLIGTATGGSSIPAMQGGRKQRHEIFTLKLLVHAARPGQTPTAARDRVIELVAVVDGVLADDPRLPLDGNAVPGLIHAQLGEWAGPSLEAHGTEGFGAWCEVDIDCEARLI